MGKINFFREDLFLDLKAIFNNVELCPLSPYLKKYLGYNIRKGKLTGDLEYVVSKNKIHGRNNVYIDQLELGDRVYSTQSIVLPSKFSIDFLKDVKGNLTLSIPVRGDLSDPEFSLENVILQAVTNVVSRGVSSPFNMINSLFEGEEEISFIEFNYGSSEIDSEDIKKLDLLVTVLHERPSLIVEIEGQVAYENDREGLRQHHLKRLLKSYKIKDMIDKSQSSYLQKEITIEPEEYDIYIKKAYKNTIPPGLITNSGFNRRFQTDEMEKILLSQIKITENELRLLAHQRAIRVKNYILRSKKITMERLYITEPILHRYGTEGSNIRKSRVNLRLK